MFILVATFSCIYYYFSLLSTTQVCDPPQHTESHCFYVPNETFCLLHSAGKQKLTPFCLFILKKQVHRNKKETVILYLCVFFCCHFPLSYHLVPTSFVKHISCLVEPDLSPSVSAGSDRHAKMMIVLLRHELQWEADLMFHQKNSQTSLCVSLFTRLCLSNLIW